MDQYRFLIGGELADPHSAETFVTENPATGKTMAEVPAGDQQDVDDAVTAARTAFDSGWRWSTPDERTAVLRRIAKPGRRAIGQPPKAGGADCVRGSPAIPAEIRWQAARKRSAKRAKTTRTVLRRRT